MVKGILFRDATLPSLYNFFLGLNMYKYRYLTLQDLIQGNCGEVISHIDYDCGPDVQKEIDLYIETLTKKLIPFHKIKLETIRMKSYLPVDNSGEIDFRPLQFFYESTKSEADYSFIKDKENVLLLIARLMQIFETTFKGILNGKTVLESLSFAVSICFLSCVVFQDKYTISLLEREKRVNEEIRSRLKLIKRLARPEVFQGIKEKYF